MAKRKLRTDTSDRTITGQHEIELREAVLDLIQGVLKDASNSNGGRNRLFPNGVGLVEVQATLDLPKFTLSARIADTQYPATPSKPVSVFAAERIATIADEILAYCVDLDRNNDPALGDCNAFVKKVGSHFGVAIPDKNADGIVDAMIGPPFSRTTLDPSEAMNWAKDGLVVAGMKKSELDNYGPHSNGHVAIVHATEDPNHPGFPMASWGVLNGRGNSNTTIRLSFPAKACDENAVHFAFAKTALNAALAEKRNLSRTRE